MKLTDETTWYLEFFIRVHRLEIVTTPLIMLAFLFASYVSISTGDIFIVKALFIVLFSAFGVFFAYRLGTLIEACRELERRCC